MALKQFTKDELWKLYEKLPDELKEAVFSQETADHIFSVCERNQVDEVSRVSYYVGLVLMGVLLPGDFQKALEEELKLKGVAARGVATEINRFVFYPVKPVLEQLHKMEIEVSAKIVTPEPLIEPEGSSEPERPAAEAETPAGEPDSYREPIE